MKKASKQPRRKHIPQRTCVGCGQVQGKRDMTRVVRTAEGQVQVDPTGKCSGRGAYMHQARECWQLALQNRRLELALRVTLSEQDRVELLKFAETLA